VRPRHVLLVGRFSPLAALAECHRRRRARTGTGPATSRGGKVVDGILTQWFLRQLAAK
jgi:hypothetical protein